MTWKYQHGPRRKVVWCSAPTVSAFGGKTYYWVKLSCGHKQNTRVNTKSGEPRTAHCDECRKEN